MTTRRLVLTRSAAVVGAASTGLLLPQIVRAQSGKIRVGLMLPYTGTYAPLGVAIENGFRMAIDEKGGKLGGREIEWFKVDDESEPPKAVENASRLVQRDKVDVIVGTVHSGRADGHPEGRPRKRRPEHHPERRRACSHPGAVRAQRVPHLLHQLAADVGARQADVGQGRQARRLDHPQVRRRRRGLRRFPRQLHQGRRHGDEGTRPALPAGGVPGAADRNRQPQAGRRRLLLRRRRGRQVHPRLRRGGPQGQDSAVRLRLPDRGRSRRRGTRRRRHHHHAALQRLARHAPQQAVPPGVRQDVPPAARRLCGPGLRRRASCS